MASLNVQAQIRRNAETVQDYFRDLQKWRSAIRESEAAGAGAKIATTSSRTPPLDARPSDSSTAFLGSSQNERQDHEQRSTHGVEARGHSVLPMCKNKPVLARDKNSIASYYAAWDRFNVDEELAKLDRADSREHTRHPQNEFKMAPQADSKKDPKRFSSTTQRQGKATMRTLVKTRETKNAEAANTQAADWSTASSLRTERSSEDMHTVLQRLRTQLLDALAGNQASLLDYSFSKCRSARKGFEACLSCLEEQSLSRALSISASVQPPPSLLSHWKKIRSIFQTNLGFSQLCLARSSRAIECATSAQVDWPESPFVHLLQAACHKNDGNYIEAERHLRDLLARLGSEEQPTPTHTGEERNPKGAPGPTTEDLLVACVAAFDTSDFNFLSSTVAIAFAKPETAAAAFVRANTQNGVYRAQLPENALGTTVAQEPPVAGAQCSTETTCLRGSQDLTGTTCSRSAVPLSRTECIEVLDSRYTGTRKEQEGPGRTIPNVIPGPCFVLKDAVSAELTETLALRHREVLALRRRRQQHFWQLNQKHLQELENESQMKVGFLEATSVSKVEEGSFGRSKTSKMEKCYSERATTSHLGDSHVRAVETSRQNGATRFMLGRRLPVHDLRGNLCFKERHPQCQVPLKPLQDVQKQAEGCTLNSDEPTQGIKCLAMPTTHAEENEVFRGKSDTAIKGKDEQMCRGNTSLSSPIDVEGETNDHDHCVRDQPRDSSAVCLRCVVTVKESTAAPVPQIKAASEAPHADHTAWKSARTSATNVPRTLPPSTYFSFQKEWNAACCHDVDWDCRANLGTSACSSANMVAQPHDNRTAAKKSSLRCMACFQNKLALLVSIAEYELFARVFSVSLEPDILADILEVIAEGLQYTGQSNNEKGFTMSDRLESGSQLDVTTAMGHTSPSKCPSTGKAPEGGSTARHPGANMPETKGWLRLSCVHNIVVQLSELPRFWSVVYQFDEQEMRRLHSVLHCCLQDGETSGHVLQDTRPSTQAGLSTVKQSAVPRVRSEKHQAQCSLVDRICGIRARLLEVAL